MPRTRSQTPPRTRRTCTDLGRTRTVTDLGSVTDGRRHFTDLGSGHRQTGTRPDFRLPSRTRTDFGKVTDGHGTVTDLRSVRDRRGHYRYRIRSPTNTDTHGSQTSVTDGHGFRKGHGRTRTDTDFGWVTDGHGQSRISDQVTDKHRHARISERSRTDTDSHGSQIRHGQTRTFTDLIRSTDTHGHARIADFRHGRARILMLEAFRRCQRFCG